MVSPDDIQADEAVAACEWVFGARPPAQVLRVLADAGCGAVEVSGEPDRPDRARLPALLEQAGIAASGITATCCWPTDERDLAHSDAAARRRAVGYYRRCVDLAKEIGSPAVAVIPASVGRLEPMTSVSREWRYAVEGVQEVAHYAGECGVTVAVEAINRYETFLVSTAEQADALVADCELPNVAVVLDTYHMNIEEEQPERSVEQLVARLAALHLADSNRRGLGRGHLDWQACVRAALGRGFTGPFTLECTARGPNPFTPQNDPDAMALLDGYVDQSVAALRPLLAQAPAGA